MKTKPILYCITLFIVNLIYSQVPAGFIKDNSLSDDFNYPSKNSAFYKKWMDNNPAKWEGPGATKFNSNNVILNGSGKLILAATHFSGGETHTENGKKWIRSVHTGFVASKIRITPPVYFEASMKANDLKLANNFWAKLGTPTNDTEIDVVETYSDKDNSNNNFHIFRKPGIYDYSKQQVLPAGRDVETNFIKYGCYWISEKEMIFYVDGEERRHIYPCAPRSQDIINHPGGDYFISDALRIILDTEAHTWRGQENVPSKAELDERIKNDPTYSRQMQVDYMYVYKKGPDTNVTFGCGDGSSPTSTGTATSGSGKSYITTFPSAIDNSKKGYDVKALFGQSGKAIISLKDKNSGFKSYGFTSKNVNAGDNDINFYIKIDIPIPAFGTDLIWELEMTNGATGYDSKSVKFDGEPSLSTLSAIPQSTNNNGSGNPSIQQAQSSVSRAIKGYSLKAYFPQSGYASFHLKDKNNNYKSYGQVGKSVSAGSTVNFWLKMKEYISGNNLDLIWELKVDEGRKGYAVKNVGIGNAATPTNIKTAPTNTNSGSGNPSIQQAQTSISRAVKGYSLKAYFPQSGYASFHLKDKNNNYKSYGQVGKSVSAGSTVNFWLKMKEYISGNNLDLIWELKVDDGRKGYAVKNVGINSAKKLSRSIDNWSLANNPVNENFVEVLGTTDLNVVLYNIDGIVIPCNKYLSETKNSVVVEFSHSINIGMYILKSVNGKSLKLIKN